MILFEKQGLAFIPLKWKAIITVPNIVLAIFMIAGLIAGLIHNWGFLFVISLYVLGAGVVQLYALNKARALVIETQEYGLRIVYRKYFSVKEVSIPNEAVKVELYDSGFGTYFGSPYYLYFYSRLNDKIDIELHQYYDTIAKVLLQLNKENKIQLQSKELAFIEKYREQLRWNRSAFGKVINYLIAGFFIGMIILIIYYAL